VNRTPLYDTHLALGARIVSFGGWEMPVWYEGLQAEHEAVRTGVGLFDVSHMGEFHIGGAGALEYVRRMLTNDAKDLEIGQAHYTLMPNETGGTVDDLLLYRLADRDYMMVVNAANIEKDRAWLERHLTSDVEFQDRSPDTSLLALQGPLALEVLAKVADYDVVSIGYYHGVELTIAGIRTFTSRTGYTGEDGFEVMIDNADASTVWEALMDAGADAGIRPAGLGARDSLRLEAAMALYGQELTDDISALEAGLGYFVKLRPEMMGFERLNREKEEGVSRKLIGMECTGRGIPRQGYAIMADSEVIGEVTSGTLSPTLGVAIAMGYVPPEFAKVGTELAVEVRGKLVPARVVKRPFYRRSDKK
jgi:aminomethyltransferase